MAEVTYNPEEITGKMNDDFWDNIQKVIDKNPAPKELLFFGTEEELNDFIKTVKIDKGIYDRGVPVHYHNGIPIKNKK